MKATWIITLTILGVSGLTVSGCADAALPIDESSCFQEGDGKLVCFVVADYEFHFQPLKSGVEMEIDDDANNSSTDLFVDVDAVDQLPAEGQLVNQQSPRLPPIEEADVLCPSVILSPDDVELCLVEAVMQEQCNDHQAIVCIYDDCGVIG